MLAAYGVAPWAMAADSPPPPQDLANPGVASVVTASGMRIHAWRTGWVGVKGTHRELDVPDWMALPSILLGRQWAAWMPIIVFAVEHPEGVIVVDTGPAAEINDAGYFDCDKRNAWFYQRNMRFAVPPNEMLGARLQQAGIEPSRVNRLVITHFHADHVGGVHLLPQARAYTGPDHWPHHVGAFTCRLPLGFEPVPVAFKPEPVVGLSQSHALTSDGKVRIVPLPGHTPGHVGLAVSDGGRTWLMAGDATFDEGQTDRGAVTGVSQDIGQARVTQGVLKQTLAQRGVVLLPSHDPTVFMRLPKP
jgi:N-acyl homoserine lactone hydrolase